MSHAFGLIQRYLHNTAFRSSPAPMDIQDAVFVDQDSYEDEDETRFDDENSDFMNSLDDVCDSGGADDGDAVPHSGDSSTLTSSNHRSLSRDTTGARDSRRYSPVYQFFSLSVTSEGNHCWVCNLCESARRDDDEGDLTASYRPPKATWAAPNTTNFWRHLSKFHKPQHKSIAPSRVPTQDGSEAIDSEGVFGKETASKATKTLADWLVEESHPYVLVDQKGFKKYSGILRKEYKVPCRQTIRSKIQASWEKEKGLVRSKLLDDLKDGRRWSATTDMWTSSARRGYMVITLHYIDIDWSPRSVMVAFVRVLYPHDGDRLAKAFTKATDAMSPWLMQKLWTVTADNASNNAPMVNNMTAARQAKLDNLNAVLAPAQPQPASPQPDVTIQAPKIVYLRCLAHVLQLAVKEGVKKCPDINLALGGLRDVVKKFQDSSKLYEKYEDVCKSLQGVTARKFKLDVETRWNSTYDMIDHLLQSRTAIADLAHRIDLQVDHYRDFGRDVAKSLVIAPEAWKAAELYHSFLLPFKEATVLLSGSTYPTLGIVSLLYRTVVKHVDDKIAAAEAELVEASAVASAEQSTADEQDQSSSSSQATASVPETVDRERVRPTSARELAAKRSILFFKGTRAKLADYQDIAVGKEAILAAAFDPRTKHMTSSTTRELLVDEFYANFEERFSAQNGDDSHLLSPPSKYPALMKLLRGSAGVVETRRSIWQEVDEWIVEEGLKLESSSREVLGWHKKHAAKFPRMSLMAREFMAVPATSVPSEQAFSKAGCTVNEKRTRLGDESVQAICELQSFIAFNEKEKQKQKEEEEKKKKQNSV